MGIESLVSVIFWLLIVGCIVGLLYWLTQYIPEPFQKVARVILAVVSVLIVINMLLGLLGYPMFIPRR